MAETLIYLWDGRDTKSIRHSVDTLCLGQSQVSSIFYQKLQECEVLLGEHSPQVLASIVGPRRLPRNLKDMWNKTEVEVSRFLASLDLINEPFIPSEDAEMRAPSGEDSFKLVKDFWDQNVLVVYYLNSEQARRDLNLIQLAQGTYYESRILRAAVFSGIYQDNPLLS